MSHVFRLFFSPLRKVSDEIIKPDDKDFESGLKVASVIRIGRLAAVGGETMLGAMGEIDSERLNRIKTRLAKWLTESDK